MRIALAADHAGFELKNLIGKFLADKHDVTDLGAHEYVATDGYPDTGIQVAEAIQRGDCDRGIAICGSGVGMSVVINKFRGVYAAVCHDTYSARQGVEHDQMNVLCLGARIIGSALAEKIVSEFVDATPLDEVKFTQRVDQIKLVESENFQPD